MANRDYNYRKYKRYVKGIKRVKIDRAEHGADRTCPCFCEDATHGRGAIFSRFADTPKDCQHWMCSKDLKGDYPWEASHVVPEE